MTFSSKNLQKIEQLKKKYPKDEALTLPLLWIAQYQEGHISIDMIKEVAQYCNKSAMEVYSVASFYTMFNLQPVGKYHIQVCKTLSCKLCGQEDIFSSLKNILDINTNQTTDDNLFTLSQVECLGSCGTSPVMEINDKYYENLTPQKVEDIIEELKDDKRS